MNLGKSIIYLSALATTTLLTGCGDDKKPQANTVVEPVVQDGPQVDTPTTDDTPVPATNIKDIDFVDTKVDLEGDFRIKEVLRDHGGNYYVAIVSSVKETPTAAPVRGYVVMKFDNAGKELWRFPTIENASATPNSSSKIGSYLVGDLYDMDVSKDGDVLLLGLKSSMTKLAADMRAANFSAEKWQATIWPASEANGNSQKTEFLGNLVFVTKVRGSGRTPNSPIADVTTTLASPAWWQPIAISWESSGSILIESSSGGNGQGIVKNVERLDNKLSKVSSAACYLAPSAMATSGQNRLALIASAASQSLVENMTASLKPNFQIAAANAEAFSLAARTSVMGDKGHCWELFAAKIMTDTDSQHNVAKPTVLATNEGMAYRVASEKDLLDRKPAFESYDLNTSLIPTDLPWYATNIETAIKPNENPMAKWYAVDADLVYLGFSNADLLGNRNLVLSNHRLLETKTWALDLQTNSMRQPASLDLIRTETDMMMAWTDLHLAGETNAGQRALRIAKADAVTPANESLEIHSFEVPATIGHTTFTSVRLGRAANGAAVFATAGTTNASTNEIEQATLLIGFTK